MKKTMRVITLVLALAVITPAAMQAQLFDKGNIVMSGGIGLGSTLFAFGSLYSTSVPPIWISGDYCIREDLGPGNLGVGGILAYSAFKWGDKTLGAKYTAFVIAARGTYHFTDLVEKLDLYGGIDVGAKIVSSKDYGFTTGYSTYGSGVLFEPFAGARYYFVNNFAANAELGYGIAWFKLGVSLKF